MPWLYPFKCPTCEAHEDRLKPITLWDQPEFCDLCGRRMVRVYSNLARVGLVPHMAKYSEDWRDPLSAADRLVADKEADKRYEENWKAKELDAQDRAIGGTRVG